MRFLRQSTASQEILLGPFVAAADGTPQTGLTIANTDIKLLFGGGTSENNKNSGGGTHIAGGRYSAVLDATDTATVGILEVSVNPASGIPWNKSYYVLEEAVFDAFFAASAVGIPSIPANWITAAGIATDAIDADAIADNAINAGAIATGAITSAKFAAGAIDAAAIADGAIDAGALAADCITAAKLAADVTTELQSGLATAAALDTVDNFLDTEVAAILAAVDTEVAAIKAVTDLLPDAGALTSLATQASVNTIDDFLDTEIAAIKAKTDQLTFSVANQVDANALTIDEDEILDDALTDSVPADGALPTVRQALYMLTQFMFERSVSGTTLTVNKADGTTALMTFTLNDGTSPTAITRAT